jgi:hypothetical protein
MFHVKHRVSLAIPNFEGVSRGTEEQKVKLKFKFILARSESSLKLKFRQPTRAGLAKPLAC